MRQFESAEDVRMFLRGHWEPVNRDADDGRAGEEVWGLVCPLCAAIVRPAVVRSVPGRRTGQQIHTEWHITIWQLADRS